MAVLRDYQVKAVKQMKNGCILNGGVGSGKSRTALAYYCLVNGGKIEDDFMPITRYYCDLYIITTAKKRDSKEWEFDDMPVFRLSPNKDLNYFKNKVVVDSWNNIKKYADVKDAFFIFDEQRVVGSGAWVKAFLKIAKNNRWILLSATPGDTFSDYLPVFIANGFFKNKTEFNRDHVVFSRYTKYPKIERYLNTRKLLRLRDSILVDMDFERPTERHDEPIYCEYDRETYKYVTKERWNPYDNKPIETASELCYLWRKIVNTDISRQTKLLELFEDHPKMIVFYNFDYELDILHILFDQLSNVGVAEWNGHRHQPVPNEYDSWVYFVQYTAGAEAWNCITTNTIVFYSQNYSYKILEQASGRIDRMNTPFHDLYYYHLRSHAPIDDAIARAIRQKKKFNETKYTANMFA